MQPQNWRSVSLAFGVLVALGWAGIIYPGQHAPAAGVGWAHADESDGPLGLVDHMEVMQDHLRKLKQQITDPRQNPTSAQLAGDMVLSAVLSKQLDPPMARTLASEQRPAFLLAYRKKMNELAQVLLRLEAALLDNDNAAAQKHLEDALQLRFKGHRQFRQEG